MGCSATGAKSRDQDVCIEHDLMRQLDCPGPCSVYNPRLIPFLRLLLLPRVRLLAEILFLRRQLALYQEREAKACRPDTSTKLALVWLSRLFDWREALVIVKPETLIGRHRQGFRLLWRWKSRRRGRPALPKNIQALVRQMARDNPSWGEQRIADELSLKLGIRISPAPSMATFIRCEARVEHPPNGGPPSFATMHKRLLFATSSRWSPPISACCMCLWPWRSARAACSIST